MELKEPSQSPSTSPDEKEEERLCPVCGAVWVKTEPTLTQVRAGVKEAFGAHRADIKALSDDGKAGYCGSVATGSVGAHKPHAGMEPDVRGECGTRFDIDGFVISAFARKIPAFAGKRWASRNKVTRDLEKAIRTTLVAKPAMAHIRGGKKGFSMVLYLPAEEAKVTRKGGILLVV